jgi:hypothetical protein
LVEKVQAILGSDFIPDPINTGVIFYHGLNRILKPVIQVNHLKVEFNVSITNVEGLIVLTKEEARAKKMGTFRIYQGKSLDTEMKLVQEAKEVYLKKQ